MKFGASFGNPVLVLVVTLVAGLALLACILVKALA